VFILYTMCHSHAALRDRSGVPAGSSIVALSDNAAIDNDIERWVGSLSSLNVSTASILELLLVYLTEGVRNRYSPKLKVVGAGTILLEDLLEQHIGSAIPRSTILYVSSLTLDEKTAKAVAGKISSSSSTWNIKAVEYGKAHAFVLGSFITK
jgi:hypothetical protein